MRPALTLPHQDYIAWPFKEEEKAEGGSGVHAAWARFPKAKSKLGRPRTERIGSPEMAGLETYTLRQSTPKKSVCHNPPRHAGGGWGAACPPRRNWGVACPVPGAPVVYPIRSTSGAGSLAEPVGSPALCSPGAALPKGDSGAACGLLPTSTRPDARLARGAPHCACRGWQPGWWRTHQRPAERQPQRSAGGPAGRPTRQRSTPCRLQGDVVPATDPVLAAPGCLKLSDWCWV